MVRSTRFVVVAGCLLALWSTSASAQVREVRGQVGASINNPGLQNALEMVWTWPTTRSSHPLLSGAHVSTGITNLLTPTQVRFGGWVEVSPLSIVDLRAGVDPSAYFGTFDSLMGFSSYDEPFDPDSREARGDATSGTASRVYVSPTLKFKTGPIVASTTLDVEWWRSSTGQPFFYEPTRDTLMKSDGDRLTTSTSVLMYQFARGSAPLMIGGIHTLAQVEDAQDNRIQKIGMIAIKEFASSHLGLPHPRVTMVIGRYLKDPYKKDEWTAALGISFRR